MLIYLLLPASSSEKNAAFTVTVYFFQASSLPLSIIIIGIGDADFEGMHFCSFCDIQYWNPDNHVYDTADPCAG